MTNVEIIKKLKKSTFTDEDGEKYKLDFELGLTDDEIRHLSKKFPSARIAGELVEILKETKGWSGYGLETAYFDSIDEFGFTELIPHSISLGHDGFGNYWVLEIKDNGDLGNIYFACHDPAVLVLYCGTLNEYFKTLVEFFETPDNNYLNEVHEKIVMDVWKATPNTQDIADFRTANSDLSSFLSEFTDDDWVVADLRKGEKTDGFAWGKFGPNQLTKKHPIESIWVIKKRKRGFISKLFGR